MEKPNVESIDGLSPAISIDQKTTSRNPRSTVGTVTEDVIKKYILEQEEASKKEDKSGASF